MRCAVAITLALFFAATLARPSTQFTEEAATRGISYSTPFSSGFGFGIALIDLDDDGDLDALMVGRVDGLVGVYENDGTGNFIDRSLTSGIPLIAQASGVCAADYDADGDLDLYFSNWLSANLLMRNDGGFSFVDVTAVAGVGDTGAGQSCAWGDYDLDGRVDLYLANRTGSNLNNEPNRLYRNLGNGTFQDVLGAVGMDADRPAFQALFFDFDRDGDADIYVSNDKCVSTDTNRLWENVNGSFTEITASSQTGVCIDSMGVAVGDFDGNLLQDLYPTNTEGGNPLLLNQVSGTFIDFTTTAAVGSYAISWAAMFLDCDNDTHVELYVCNVNAPNRLYDHDGTWPSVDLAPSAGCADPGFSYGAAYGDIDNDGDLDIVVSNSPGDVHLYLNHEGELRNWIKFHVHGQGENLRGIGALVDLRLGSTWQTREVLAGSNSYKSQNEMKVHFGLDSATSVDEVIVTWPGATTTRTIVGLSANNIWTLYPPEVLGDGDLDGDNDVDDFYIFVDCFTGAVPSSLAPGCETMDLDGDADVDYDDFAEFLNRYDGIIEDCNDNGITDLRDILDGSSDDLDQDGRPDECATASPSGAIPPGGAGGGLSIQRSGSDLTLSWVGSCEAGDTDYGIYGGALGSFADPTPLTCSTSGAMSWNLTPLAGNRYYLVVPRNILREGSYGQATAGPRAVSTAACAPQDVVACP